MGIRRRRIAGFSLIELMVVVAIVAILVAIAVPAYTRYGFRARRPDGQKLLLAIANAEERYYALHNAYGDLQVIGFSTTTTATSDATYYKATVTASAVGAFANQAYVATAVPQGPQANDACANLSLTNTGVKAASGSTTNGSCW